MRRARRLVLALALTLAVGGCSCSRDTGPAPLSEQQLARIPPVTPEGLQSLLAEQQGKVVVLAVWSVTRQASLAVYPKLGDLAGAGGEPVVIAVNIDHVDDVRDQVLPLLDKHQPTFVNRVCRVGPEGLASFMDMRWSGQVPALSLFDRGGKKVATFHGPGAFAKAQAVLPTLLKSAKR